MTGEFKVLAPLAEALALTTNNINKNIILGALDLRGPLNLDALKMAVSEIGNIFPQIKAHIKEVKFHQKNCLAWEFSSESNPPPVFVHEANTNNDSIRGSLKILLESLAPRLDRERDIFHESAAEFHLLSFDKNRHILACALWHPAGDAITFAEIVKAFMSMYHELVTGQNRMFSNHPMSVSTGSKRFIHSHKTNLADYWKTFREAIIPYSCCSVPRGNGVQGDSREHYIKRLLSEAETQRLVSNAAKMRATFVDYLLSTVCLSVDRWNDVRETESSVISAALTVNMQGRNLEQEGPNNDSVLYFRFSREQRKDPQILARTVYRARIRKFREGADLKYSKGLAKVNNLLRNFPFSIRQKAYIKILQKHQTSFALGFIGVLWPESLGRNISGDSYLKEVGALSVVEAHGIAYRIVSRTPLYLSAYFYRKRLNLILSAAAWLFTKDEAQEFLDLITNMMLEYEPGDSTT